MTSGFFVARIFTNTRNDFCFKSENGSSIPLPLCTLGTSYLVFVLNGKLQRQYYRVSDLSLTEYEVNPESYPVSASIYSDFSRN